MQNASDAHEISIVRDLVRLHSSLEPETLLHALRDVCSKRLQSCVARILVFDDDDHSSVREFGSEGAAIEAPPTPAPGDLEWSRPAVDGAGNAALQETTIVLQVDADIVGFLRLSTDHVLDAATLAFIDLLKTSLGYSLRNALTFEKTRRLTFTDDLTALYNSRFMALYLDREIKRCRRAKSSLSLLFMDLDGFKQVNDVHGHLAGSRTLVEVGAVLEKTVRDADVLIRYGGDEFVIVFPETPLSGGLIIAERIRHVIAATQFLETRGIDARVSASIGIAAYPENAEDVRGLISSADAAMYRAKALGKNRVVSADPFGSNVEKRL